MTSAARNLPVWEDGFLNHHPNENRSCSVAKNFCGSPLRRDTSRSAEKSMKPTNMFLILLLKTGKTKRQRERERKRDICR